MRNEESSNLTALTFPPSRDRIYPLGLDYLSTFADFSRLSVSSMGVRVD